MIAIVGALVLTLIPLAYTLFILNGLLMQWGWAGFSILDWKDWGLFAALVVVGGLLWWGWWVWVASSISISIGVS